jgi:hypothetical protein
MLLICGIQQENQTFFLTCLSSNFVAVVKCEILTAKNVGLTMFWDVTPFRLITVYQTARRHVPENRNLNLHCS